jgi:hypothetical protein
MGMQSRSDATFKHFLQIPCWLSWATLLGDEDWSEPARLNNCENSVEIGIASLLKRREF